LGSIRVIDGMGVVPKGARGLVGWLGRWLEALGEGKMVWSVVEAVASGQTLGGDVDSLLRISGCVRVRRIVQQRRDSNGVLLRLR